MMGERRVMQEALFYGFSLERHVPDNHMLRRIDRFVDLSDLRAHLGPYYSDVGRPSIDPELMIRMLIVGYCFGIRSERRLCDEVHLNLAYRWFCRLGLDGDVPDHSTFSKNRHGRFRESDLLRKLFETVVARCMKEGIVGGEAFAVDASIIVADAHRRRGVAKIEDLDPTSSRAVAEYLSVLDDAAFGGATPVEPKAISPTDPAARYTASANSLAGYAYSDNYLIDLKHAVIMDVEATTTIRQAEVGAAKTMLDRTAEQFDVTPSRLVADGGYGSAEMVGWLVDERGIEPHVNLIDKTERTDGTFSRSDFAFDPESNLYVCPGGKELKKYHRAFAKPRDGLTKDGTMIYFARKHDCEACALKPKCCPNVPARKIARSVHEAARDKARAIAKTEAYAVSCRERKKVEMLFAHLKRILRLGRLRLRGPSGAKDEFLLAATAQNLRKRTIDVDRRFASALPIGSIDPERTGYAGKPRGLGPPVAQSSSSAVCTTGSPVPAAIWVMHPIFPAAIRSGAVLSILATRRKAEEIIARGPGPHPSRPGEIAGENAAERRLAVSNPAVQRPASAALPQAQPRFRPSASRRAR